MKRTKDEIIDDAIEYQKQGYNCAQSVLMSFSEEIELDMDTAKRISSTFGGGMGMMKKTCGALTGGFMVLGFKYGFSEPPVRSQKVASHARVRKLYNFIEEKHGSTDCDCLVSTFARETKYQVSKNSLCQGLIRDSLSLVYDMMVEEAKSIK